MTAPAYYSQQAATYAASTRDVDMSPLYARFLPQVPAGGRILDAGCGSGRDALAFRQRGYAVEAFDASPEMAALASAHAGLAVQVMDFLSMTMGHPGDQGFDAIWACASLLHVAAADQPQAWARLWRTLKPGGVMYASYKLGEGEHVDEMGRPFTDADAASVAGWLQGLPGLGQAETWITGDRRPGQRQAWVNVLVACRPHLP